MCCTHNYFSQGATDAIINSMPITIITEEMISEEKTCPVCLSDMNVGEEARLLACRHLFHKAVSIIEFDHIPSPKCIYS